MPPTDPWQILSRVEIDTLFITVGRPFQNFLWYITRFVKMKFFVTLFFYQSMNALFSTSWIKPECPMRKEQLDWNHSISTITSLWVLSSPAFLMPTRYHTSPRCSLFFSFYVVLSFGCIIILGLCSLRSCLLLGPLCCFPSLLLMENGWSCFFSKKKYREHLI